MELNSSKILGNGRFRSVGLNKAQMEKKLKSFQFLEIIFQFSEYSLLSMMVCLQ